MNPNKGRSPREEWGENCWRGRGGGGEGEGGGGGGGGGEGEAK
jgi:hypothetical protein